MLFSKDPKVRERIKKLTVCVHFMNNEFKIDFRALNLMRNTLLKEVPENENNPCITEERFIQVVEQFLKVKDFKDSELFNKMQDCLTEEQQ